MKNLILGFIIFVGQLQAQQETNLHVPHHFKLTTPAFVISKIGFTLEISAHKVDGSVDTSFNGEVQIHNADVQLAGTSLFLKNGKLVLKNVIVHFVGNQDIVVEYGSVRSSANVRSIPGFLTLLPPLLAILLALTLRQVIISLFMGIWLGAVIIFNYNPLDGLYRVVDHFVLGALKDPNHISIIIFSLLFGGMAGVITRNGGTLGIANLITRYAKTQRGGQIASWFMSFVLFFDDYANVLVRGNLMRPITDTLKISREKLAFIVDAGAATVASIVIISTWIGFEVGLIDQSLKAIGSTEDAYTVFLLTIPYRFYPILMLILVLLIGLLDRDFGPMLTAEQRARLEGKVIRDGAQPATDVTALAEVSSATNVGRWYNGFIPIVTILLVGVYGLYSTGMESLRASQAVDYSISSIISNANSYTSLLWASFSACVVSIFISVVQKILTLAQAVDAWFKGMRSMFLAMIILVLAWSIGAVTEEIRTADYMIQLLRGAIEPYWLPVLTFLIAALISFATGTSWGTMAIMMPLVIPLGHNLSMDAGLQGSEYQTILYGVISSVLAGAVFGDHCSPISDTTVLSSMASACDHIDHVRTQLPYAVLAAVVGMLVGDIPTAFGFSPYLSILVGTLVMIGFLYLFGRKVGMR